MRTKNAQPTSIEATRVGVAHIVQLLIISDTDRTENVEAKEVAKQLKNASTQRMKKQRPQ